MFQLIGRGAMSGAIKLRDDYSGEELRRLAAVAADGAGGNI